jgi:hypothetical protein
MMMQMLAAGGMPILTDGVRGPDEDNPRGYFEFEAVKRTKQDPSWVPTAVGKAVKMVTVLLRDLPPAFEYRVILMQRDFDEVLQSQKRMLARLARTGANVPDHRLKELFSNELTKSALWLGQQRNFRFSSVEYRQCLDDPFMVAREVDRLLEGQLSVDKVAAAVDKHLYRSKIP